MNKIIVISCPGAGKSTFAGALHAAERQTSSGYAVDDSPDEEAPAFYSFIQNYHTWCRPQIMTLLETYSYKHIYRFTNRDETEAFLKQI